MLLIPLLAFLFASLLVAAAAMALAPANAATIERRLSEVLTGERVAQPADELYKVWQDGSLHRNFMGYTVQKSSCLLGLGLSAISDTGHAYAQNTKSLQEYYRTIASGRPAIRKGYFLREEDKAFKQHILEIACKGHTTLDRTWDTQLKEWTLPVLRDLEQDGLVRVEGDEVSLTKEGQPFLRHVCKAFDLHLLHARPQA